MERLAIEVLVEYDGSIDKDKLLDVIWNAVVDYTEAHPESRVQNHMVEEV